MKKFKWQVIIDWFEENGRHDFPWRDYHHSLDTLIYRVWLAEILLQQTQAERVIPFYTRILETYPTIGHLGKTSYEEFFPYYQGLGYYSRARNLLKTAKHISEAYGGRFPEKIEELKKLPGVGEYTARAIRAFGYGKPVLAWDTNLETIFARYYNGNKYEKLSQEQKSEIETGYKEFLSKIGILKEQVDGVRNINNGLMDWARTMEPKNRELFDKKTYILTESRFALSEGTLEPVIKKESTSFPIPDASIVVVIHKDHKVYYSREDTYSPFILPPALHRDTRKYVQEFFRETYSLELSVRPVHKKWLSKEGKPYVALNAQVQTGKIDFKEFAKKDIKGYLIP